MSYKNFLVKDKNDINEKFFTEFPGATVLGAMEKVAGFDFNAIEILSVKFTKVGKTMLDRFPNLKWVINRGHGTDNINLDLCRQKNVGVCAMNPFTENCGQWILDKTEKTEEPYVVYGYGNIGKYVAKHLSGRFVVATRKPIRIDYLKTLIVTVDLNPTTEKMINETFMRQIKQPFYLISVARGGVFNNADLLKEIKNGKILHAYMDILSSDYRDELLATGKVDYTEHTSWNFGGAVFNENYYKKLKDYYEKCMRDNPENIVLNRRKNKWL